MPNGGSDCCGTCRFNSWNGDHTRPNAISRLRYHQMYVDDILKRIEATAPRGADLTSWRYK